MYKNLKKEKEEEEEEWTVLWLSVVCGWAVGAERKKKKPMQRVL